MEYNKLIKEKTYDDMTDEEFYFCIKVETEYYRDKVNNLRKENVPDYKIAAYIYDLWAVYWIANYIELAKAFKISKKDWIKGMDYYWNEMDEISPFKQFNIEGE